MDARLRVGILLDAIFVPAWALNALERIARSTYAEFALIILNRSSLKRVPAWRERQVDPHFWLYRVFEVIDEKLFLREPKALTRVNASTILSNVPVLEVGPVDEEEKQRFSPSDVEQIKSYHLDVLVKMGFGNLHGDVLSAANYGVWAYRWGDVSATQDESAGFWEVAEGQPETRVALQQLGLQDKQNKILFESWFFTYPYSPARSRNYILWSAASFLPRQLERLYRFGGEKYFQERKNAETKHPGQSKSTGVPSNLKALSIMIKLGARNLLEIYRRVFLREQWNLLFDFGPDREKNISTFKKISPPNDRFWADPHVICKAPDYFVFIEEYLFQTKRGHISVLEIDQKGNYKQPVPVLQKDYHLSFPFVFDWMGTYYMIP
ncbi:MAG: glucosamine inositolphosphorylceramide transferase family protein, partial [Anaerolineales bacterium]